MSYDKSLCIKPVRKYISIIKKKTSNKLQSLTCVTNDIQSHTIFWWQ